MNKTLIKAYDPQQFRKQGHQLIDLLADYLENMQGERVLEKVYSTAAPEEMYKRWEDDLSAAPHPDDTRFYKSILEESIHLHHPRYLGHQKSFVAPLSILSETLGALLDPGMGIFEQGTSGVVLEKLLSKNLGELIGWDDRCGGFMTSGGTLGNLTALLCARQVMVGIDVWEEGYRGKQYAFMVSSEAHYSVGRAIKVMGMGNQGIVKVPVDDHFRMRSDLLENYFEDAQRRGVQIIGIVASSCSTATGSYDPLEAIADFCEAKKLWLHVDGAHGACVLFSEKYRHLLNGIERADSVIMDYHKMLMTPSQVTSVLFKNTDHSYQTFAQKASYLWDKNEGREWYNLGKRTFELTKANMSLRAYVLWRTYGRAIFRENVDCLYDLGKAFSKMLDEQADFEVLLKQPDANIVCYRFLHNGWDEEETERINLKIRERMVQKGDFFIVQTRVQGRLYLRSTIMNPFTTEQTLKELLEEIRTVYQSISAT